MLKRGFTLLEVLTAVVIVTILVAIATPLYEKTIERSRLAEARTVLSRLQEAKLYTMDNMGCTTYDPRDAKCPKLGHLNVSFASGVTDKYSFSTKDFSYSLSPSGSVNANGVCAKRLGNGDTAGTLFYYYGLSGEAAPVFACSGESCEMYGFDSVKFGCNFD